MISNLFKWFIPKKPEIKIEELSPRLQAMRGSKWKNKFSKEKYTLVANSYQLYLIKDNTNFISPVDIDTLFNEYERINRKEFKGNY